MKMRSGMRQATNRMGRITGWLAQELWVAQELWLAWGLWAAGWLAQALSVAKKLRAERWQA